jgi:pimeloyl-ACP methyl ester carboxylesterase
VTAAAPGAAEVARTAGEAAPPRRPGRREEGLASRLFYALAPRLPRVALPAPPPELAPWEAVRVPRAVGAGTLSATWFPATAQARGAVLFLHPWVEWGGSYFHRRGRLEAVRRAGLHAMVVDLPGFGTSGPRHGFSDRAVGAAIAALARRCPGSPLHVWGVSAGGYWAHLALAGDERVAGAFFEDVSPHLLEWSWRLSPWGRPFFLLFRRLFPTSHRFLDARLHAPHVRLGATAHVSGAADPGVRPHDTETLAALTGGRAVVVPGAGHLEAIRRDNSGVVALALETFEAAHLPAP